MKYFSVLIILLLLISCDNRNPNEPEIEFVVIYEDDFSSDLGWEIQAVFNPAFGDTAYVNFNGDQMILCAQGGMQSTSATATYTFADSLVQQSLDTDLIFEFRIVNSIAYELGDCNIGIHFEDDFVNIGFRNYDLFNYYNSTLRLEYDHEENAIRILINGVEKDYIFMEPPGELVFVNAHVWTTDVTGSGYTILKLTRMTISKIDEES